jgi:aquaporin Z
MDRTLRACVVELLGTLAVVFVGAGAVCSASHADAVTPALAQGLIYAAALLATLPISGGYLNPAVTFALYLMRRVATTGQLAALLAAQLLGAALAGWLLTLLFPPDLLSTTHLGTPHLKGFAHLSQEARWLVGAGLLTVLSFLLTVVVLATDLDPRAARLPGLGAGLAVAAIVLMSFPLTGGGINPAVTFGTFLWEAALLPGADWREHVFVYWVAPIAGSALAVVSYGYLILPPASRDASVNPG